AQSKIESDFMNLIEEIQEKQPTNKDQQEMIEQYDLKELTLHNLKFSFHPNFKLIKESYI
ncbi:hypothetical protein R2R70_22975, partial [Cobetia sp. SIMBA_158]|uniref:hypothetical protein n=1 Tax=Cobetia sp. SIMBA_158 TaxID=3081617 RepID=UPI00397FF2C7